MSFHSRAGYFPVRSGGKTHIQTTHLATGTFPMSHSLLVHGLGIWRHALVLLDHRDYLVYYSLDLRKVISVPPGFLMTYQEKQVHRETLVLTYVFLD